MEREHRQNRAAHFVRRLGLLNPISINISNMVGTPITVPAIVAAGGIALGFVTYLALAGAKQ